MPPVDTSRINETFGNRAESQPSEAAWNEIRQSMTGAGMPGGYLQNPELANSNLVSENTIPNLQLDYGMPNPAAAANPSESGSPYTFIPQDANGGNSSQSEYRVYGGAGNSSRQYGYTGQENGSSALSAEESYQQMTLNSAIGSYNAGMTAENAMNGTPSNTGVYGGYENGTGGSVETGTTTSTGTSGGSSESEAEAASKLTSAEKSLNKNSIVQGDYGDCFFESAVDSMANTAAGRKQLAQQITTNSDGSYTVNFAGDKDSDPINVTQAEISQYGLTNKNLEANVLEAAFLEKNNIAPGDTGSDDFANATDQYPEQAMNLLNNKTANFAWTDGKSTSQLSSTIESTLKSGNIITATSNDNFSGTESNEPVIGDHQYSILGYNPSTGVITMRNPWGDENGTAIAGNGSTADGITNDGNGNITMNMSTFAKYFCATDVSS